MTSLSAPVLVGIFLAGAAIIWRAGTSLSRSTDTLAQRWNLGSALGGVVLLAVATNLPELAITVTAAGHHHVDVAVGNILGGIALQTVVLVFLDAARPRPLTYLAASLNLVIEGALVVALLVAVVMSTQLPPSVMMWRLTPGPVLIAALWVAGLLLVRRARHGLPWQAVADSPPDRDDAPAATATAPDTATTRAVTVFGGAAAATLVAGVLVERSGEEVFGRWGMSGVVFGATVLAAATALPELSTGLAAVRLGDYQLAISDIFGGNAFLPVLFLPAVLISGSPVLPAAHHADIYLTALAGLLTIAYMVGLIFRTRTQRLRMGVDSLAVLAIYAVGIAGLFVLNH